MALILLTSFFQQKLLQQLLQQLPVCKPIDTLLFKHQTVKTPLDGESICDHHQFVIAVNFAKFIIMEMETCNKSHFSVENLINESNCQASFAHPPQSHHTSLTSRTSSIDAFNQLLASAAMSFSYSPSMHKTTPTLTNTAAMLPHAMLPFCVLFPPYLPVPKPAEVWSPPRSPDSSAEQYGEWTK